MTEWQTDRGQFIGSTSKVCGSNKKTNSDFFHNSSIFSLSTFNVCSNIFVKCILLILISLSLHEQIDRNISSILTYLFQSCKRILAATCTSGIPPKQLQRTMAKESWYHTGPSMYFYTGLYLRASHFVYLSLDYQDFNMFVRQ